MSALTAAQRTGPPDKAEPSRARPLRRAGSRRGGYGYKCRPLSAAAAHEVICLLRSPLVPYRRFDKTSPVVSLLSDADLPSTRFTTPISRYPLFGTAKRGSNSDLVAGESAPHALPERRSQDSYLSARRVSPLQRTGPARRARCTAARCVRLTQRSAESRRAGPGRAPARSLRGGDAVSALTAAQHTGPPDKAGPGRARPLRRAAPGRAAVATAASAVLRVPPRRARRSACSDHVRPRPGRPERTVCTACPADSCLAAENLSLSFTDSVGVSFSGHRDPEVCGPLRPYSTSAPLSLSHF